MTGVAVQPKNRRERAPGRLLGRVPRQTLAGAIVGAIVAAALLLFSAPAEAAQSNDRPGLVTPPSAF
jgi:hypothetical protein